MPGDGVTLPVPTAAGLGQTHEAPLADLDEKTGALQGEGWTAQAAVPLRQPAIRRVFVPEAEHSARAQTFEREARRFLHRALEVWQGLRAERRLPSPRDLDQVSDPRLWRQFFVVDLHAWRMTAATPVPGLADLLYLGDGVTALSDLLHETAPPALPEAIVNLATGIGAAVANLGVPLSRTERIAMRDGNDVLVKLLMLPLSEDGLRVTQLLGVLCHSRSTLALSLSTDGTQTSAAAASAQD